MTYGLGRRVEFDERSRRYPIRDVLGAPRRPRSYTWRCGVVLDQGATDACTGVSAAQEAAARPVVVPNVTVDLGYAIYIRAQQIDQYPDTPPPGWTGPGVPPGGSSVLAAAKVMQERGLLPEYRWAFTLDDALESLSYHGPVVIGINWYRDMFEPDAGGVLHVGGRLAGGHAILVNGINVRRRAVKLHNSWGPYWGIYGEAWLGWDDLARLLGEDGECLVPVRRGVAAA